MEQLFNQSRQENSVLAVALEGARELNAKLQSNSDQSTREIALHINQSHNQETAADDLRGEIASLKQHINQSEETIYTLEVTLRKLREEQFEKEILQVPHSLIISR